MPTLGPLTASHLARIRHRPHAHTHTHFTWHSQNVCQFVYGFGGPHHPTSLSLCVRLQTRIALGHLKWIRPRDSWRLRCAWRPHRWRGENASNTAQYLWLQWPVPPNVASECVVPMEYMWKALLRGWAIADMHRHSTKIIKSISTACFVRKC